MAIICFVDRFKENIEHGYEEIQDTLFENYKGLSQYNNFRMTIDTCSEFIDTNKYNNQYMYLGKFGNVSNSEILNSMVYYDHTDEHYFDKYFTSSRPKGSCCYEKTDSHVLDPYLYVDYSPYEDAPIQAIRKYQITQIGAYPADRYEKVTPRTEYHSMFTLAIYPDFYENRNSNIGFFVTIDTYKAFETHNYMVARIKENHHRGDFGRRWDMVPVNADGILILRGLLCDIPFNKKILKGYFYENYQDIMKTVYTFVYYFGTWFLSQDEKTYIDFFRLLNEKYTAYAVAREKYYNDFPYRRYSRR